jgi:hypothetical protein
LLGALELEFLGCVVENHNVRLAFLGKGTFGLGLSVGHRRLETEAQLGCEGRSNKCEKASE